LERSVILLKSPRGRDEIRTRAHTLSPLERRLLILADGRRSVTELAFVLDRNDDDPELRDALQRLIDERYLHIRDEYDERRNTTAGHSYRRSA